MWDADRISEDSDLIYSKTQALSQGPVRIAHLKVQISQRG